MAHREPITVSAPASRQLYIRMHGRKMVDDQEINEVFRRYGIIRYVRLMPHGDTGFVSYWRTRDACEAREGLHERSVNGMNYEVHFSRSTRLLHVDAVPLNLPEREVRDILSGEFLRFGPLQSIEFSRDKVVAWVTFQREDDAIQAVAALQGHTVGAWKWEIEFHKERSGPDPAAPPVISARSIQLVDNGHGAFARAPPRLSISRSELVRRLQAVGPGRERDGAVARRDSLSEYNGRGDYRDRDRRPRDDRDQRDMRDRSPVGNRPSSSVRTPEEPGKQAQSKREDSPPATSAPDANVVDAEAEDGERRETPAAAGSPRGKQRSRESPSSSRRSRSHSPASSSSSAPSSRSPSPDDKAKRKKRSASPVARSRSPSSVPSHTCDNCDKLTGHWKKSHTEIDSDICKRMVKAWFEGHFELMREDQISDGVLTMRRSVFLTQELNPFLRSLGFAAWEADSPLFTEWFMRDLLNLTASELRRSRDFRLLRRTSRAGYRDMLQSLLADLKDD